jgi:hypothetical protein
MFLGAGLGFSLYTPITDANPAADLGAGAAVIEGLSAVFSLWFGGWVAGRFTPVGSRDTGALHGFCVWCAATVAGVLMVTIGGGWAVGSLARIAGGGLSLAGKPAAAAVANGGEMARGAARRSGDTVSSFIDEAASSRPAGSSPASAIRAKRELTLAAARYFTPNQRGNVNANRAAVVKALVDSGMTEADANQTVTDWNDTYQKLQADINEAKNEAEAKARVVADEASKDLAVFSFSAFAALVLGAIAATVGGEHGCKRANIVVEKVFVPTA